MASLQPELAAQLRFQASLIRLCTAPQMATSIRPEEPTDVDPQPQADAIEKLAVLVPLRFPPRTDR